MMMKRIIKFRGFDPTAKEWVYGFFNELEDSIFINVPKVRDIGGNIQELENYLDDVDVMPSSVGQYTGLNDKNGVEVFEGSVVKVWHEDEPEEFQIGKVWQFDCYYPAFDIYIPSKRTGTGFEGYSDEFNSFSCPDYGFEVIGNIYEHKHLIGEG